MWRLRFDTASHYLALEVRDADVLLAHFYILNTVDYTIKKVELPPEQTWWLGLEDAHEGLYLLHGYGDRKLGQHKGIKAYASTNHVLQWEQAELTFYGVAARGILAFTTDHPENTFVILDEAKGKIVNSNLSQQDAAEMVAQYGPARYGSCTYPVQYLAGEGYFMDVRNFIQHKLAVEPVKLLEYAEFNNFIVVSYYLQQPDSKLDNYLAVFDTGGDLLIKECLGEGLNGLGSDTFIIFNQNLYFIQHKEILRVYKLFY